MATDYQASSNLNIAGNERFSETVEASVSLTSLSHPLSEQTPKFILPAVRIWKTLPADPLRLIAAFAEHVHDYHKVFPDGPRDNGEYNLVCRHCGYYSWFRHVGVHGFICMPERYM